jgi:hypothetical protein
LALLFLGDSNAWASVTPVQTASIAETIPNWGPSTPSLAGQDPLVFNKFDPALGQLQSVSISMTYTTRESVSMNFTVPTTIVLKSSFAQSPNVGPTITLNGPAGGSATPLMTASAPVFTYTKTYGGSNGQSLPQSFSNNPAQYQPGSPFFLTPDGQPNNTNSSFTGTKSVTITDPSQLALFTGNGTLGLPAFATAGETVTVNGGNGSGMILTYAGVTVSLSYNYVVPEPSSMALLGLGGGGLLLVGRLRRRRTML